MNDYLKAKIHTYCYLVKRGKPAAMIAVQNRYLDDIKSVLTEEELNGYIEELSEGWSTVWIYKDDYLLEVIKKMPEKPKTVYDHWVLGKIFGYSDEAIKNYLRSNGFL